MTKNLPLCSLSCPNPATWRIYRKFQPIRIMLDHEVIPPNDILAQFCNFHFEEAYSRPKWKSYSFHKI